MSRDAIRFVQFLHPGGEHQPDARRSKTWNTGNHKRKFLVAPGRALRGADIVGDDLVFWGEWEAESEVVEVVSQPVNHGPRYICRPFYVAPQSYVGLQNTDPFVFDKFLYGICQQHKSTGPTQMRYLDKGSVVLFGSCLSDAFVLDTVFVVSDWIDHDRKSHQQALSRRVPKEYLDVSIGPLYMSGRGNENGCAPDPGRSYRLYFGATHAEPVEGMFSFFPCLPLQSARNGFARPIIRDGRTITSNLRQGLRLNPQVSQQNARALWQSVVEQVTAQGLLLGVNAEMPEKRDAKDEKRSQYERKSKIR